MVLDNKNTGAEGEALAEKLLRNRGYMILKRNYRYGKAEIDIIARIGDEIAFVEVKTRRNISDLQPDDLISSKQKRMLFLAADHYMGSYGEDAESRFDLIMVDPFRSPPLVEHIEGAFYPFDSF